MDLRLKRRRFTQGLAACSAIAGLASAPPAAGQALPQQPADLAREWQRLRALKGHFDGGGWNDEADRWQGAKHLTMQRLSAFLTQERAGPARVLQLLGPPDELLQPGQTAHGRALPQLAAPAAGVAERGELWLYRWRGTHDQLVLVVAGGQVAGVGWLHAWE